MAILKFDTNIVKNSCTTKTMPCSYTWSIAQYQCFEKLTTNADKKSSTIHLKVVQDGEARARRIAAVYAKFYLEHSNVNGNTRYKGRHFWMGLGAFASKTVADALGHWSSAADGGVLGVVYNFKLGNFWLYQDIAGWHFEYNQCSTNFSTCINQRNTNHYIPEVKKMVYDSHGAYDVLPKIRNLGASKYIKPAFDATKEFEKIPSDRLSKRKAQQRINLMQLANHEQREVLQKTIYQKINFRAGLALAEIGRGKMSIPELQMVYTSKADTDDPDLKNIASDDIKLADITKRMDWIKDVAEQFIELMNGEKRNKVEGEIVKIAGWIN
ncbi:hypothetical protein [uncultured Psychrobacter sp.]|uniref:DUF2515 family protein n=1 Tax=uncultured Psychrobacter sp. TaxID=259303 RepID=UPI0025950875|nr:hypothetical protein [uncultured Psychrobacter sp.]